LRPTAHGYLYDDGPYLPYFVIKRLGRFAPLIRSDRQGLALAALTGRRRSARLMADGWQREFDEPIETPGGTQLRTLREAVVYLAKAVPKSERDLPAVTTAAEMLTYAPERGTAWMFLAAWLSRRRCTEMRQFNPNAKQRHWGKAEAEGGPIKRNRPQRRG
jgi:hypothetical protein